TRRPGARTDFIPVTARVRVQAKPLNRLTAAASSKHPRETARTLGPDCLGALVEGSPKELHCAIKLMDRRMIEFLVVLLLVLPSLAVERSDIPDKYKWDTTQLYATDAAWAKKRDEIAGASRSSAPIRGTWASRQPSSTRRCR